MANLTARIKLVLCNLTVRLNLTRLKRKNEPALSKALDVMANLGCQFRPSAPPDRRKRQRRTPVNIIIRRAAASTSRRCHPPQQVLFNAKSPLETDLAKFTALREFSAPPPNDIDALCPVRDMRRRYGGLGAQRGGGKAGGGRKRALREVLGYRV